MNSIEENVLLRIWQFFEKLLENKIENFEKPHLIEDITKGYQ
jgi:hypothetical protein